MENSGVAYLGIPNGSGNVPLMVVIMSGLQACGKSTTAKVICRSTGFVLIANHHIRQQLPTKDELFAPSHTLMVEDLAFAMAEAELSRSRSVVLDGMHITRRSRQRAYALALKYNAIPLVIECICPDIEEIRRRVENRAGNGDPEAEGNKMEYYWRTKALQESIGDDVLASGLRPAVITFDTLNNRTFSNQSGDSAIRELNMLLRTSHESGK